MEENSIAKKANQIIKKALERLTEERDIKQFSPVPEIFNNASGMVNKNEIKGALLDAWMVSQATNIVFLLWRRQIEHEDIEKEWRELPTTDEVALKYEDLLREDQKIADALEAQRRKYMDAQHELDIFKAVLNGESKETAEARYKEYQEKLAKSMGA